MDAEMYYHRIKLKYKGKLLLLLTKNEIFIKKEADI